MYHTSGLSKFIADIDSRGGLGSPDVLDIISNFRLSYDTTIDYSADPYSDTYVDQQISLYHEIAQQTLSQTKTEACSFPMNQYVDAINPYGSNDPSNFVLHHLRMAKILRAASLPVAPRILDMGAGWGMTSEFFGMLGANVVAIDIGENFVELINKRSERLGLNISAIQGTFEQFKVQGNFDLIFFYESLHHAIRPWQVLENCSKFLKEGGKIAFAAEPIQDIWWPNWGLRLDAVSVYCIRKFGWFESGWSLPFLRDMFRKSGLFLSCECPSELGVGTLGIAGRTDIPYLAA